MSLLMEIAFPKNNRIMSCLMKMQISPPQAGIYNAEAPPQADILGIYGSKSIEYL